MLDSQATSAAIYKQLFTDSEWDAISSALNDYQDYGTEEAMIADSIQAKISTIFRLTSNWFFILINIMTITERNQKLYDLRKKLDQKRMELAWIETEIMAVNSEYDRQNLNLFEEMFGTDDDIIDPAFLDNWLTSCESFFLLCLLSSVLILGLSC